LPEYLTEIEAMGVKRIVVLSSTSVFTKEKSENQRDKETSKKLRETEIQLQKWARDNKIACTILRPTMIYGGKNNKNIITISKLIKYVGFFPIIGEASGLRQPIHYKDLSYACIAALENNNNSIEEFNLSGGEILTYKEMVTRVFKAMNYKPYFLKLPIILFKFKQCFIAVL
jgi:nucleoside-diphosphate-sugar epimerase